MEEVLDDDEEKMGHMPKLEGATHILEDVADRIASTPDSSHPPFRPYITEVEDKDNIQARFKPKISDPGYILERINKSKKAEPPPMLHEPATNKRYAYNAHRTDTKNQPTEDSSDACKDFTLPLHDPSEHSSDPCKDFTLPFHNLPGPPAPLKRVCMPKARITKPGASAVGVSVLSTKGRLASTSNSEIDLHLDSCADITVISEELYLSLQNRPPLQQGYQMQIFQLTETGTRIKGFIHIPVFMEAMDGTILETEVEAYVVPNMTVPILLGEDYHLTYEINVSRSVTEGSYLQFTGTPYSVSALGVSRMNDFDRLRKSGHHTSSFVKAKTHK